MKTCFATAVIVLVGLVTAQSQAGSAGFTPIVVKGSSIGSSGCAWGDYNNDGYPDLFVSAGRYPSDPDAAWLYRNNRDGTFTKVTSDEAGEIVSPARLWYMPSWGDYDNDGFLDLFVTDNSDDPQSALWRNLGNGMFANATDVGPFGEDRLWQTPVWGDFDRDGFLDLFVANAWDDTEYPSWSSNQLYFNHGDGCFERGAIGELAEYRGSHAEGGSAADMDGDGDLDILVTGTIQTACFENDGAGNFRKVTTGPSVKRGTIMSSWADYNNDGRLDVVVISFSGSQQPVSHLLRNDGDGQWTSTPISTLEAFYGIWADFDNDGDLDLFITGGVFTYVRSQLLSNNGDGTFSPVTDGPLVNDLRQTGSCAWADYDNDGDMDLFAAAFHSSQGVLYRNGGNGNHWISFRLVGTTSNRSAIGAKVRVQATIFGKTSWQMREIGGGNRVQNDLRPHFGLGDAAHADVVRIEWPSGIVQELKDVPANQILTVLEPPRLLPHDAGKFQIQCWINQSFDVQCSSDLETWSPAATVTNLTGTLVFEDVEADQHECRYYRVVEALP